MPNIAEVTFMKKNFGPKFGPNGPESVPKLYHFFKFGSLVFLEFAYNDSLQPCATWSIAKIHEKKLCGPNLDSKLGFCHFLKLGSLVFLAITYSDIL